MSDHQRNHVTTTRLDRNAGGSYRGRRRVRCGSGKGPRRYIHRAAPAGTWGIAHCVTACASRWVWYPCLPLRSRPLALRAVILLRARCLVVRWSCAVIPRWRTRFAHVRARSPAPANVIRFRHGRVAGLGHGRRNAPTMALRRTIEIARAAGAGGTSGAPPVCMISSSGSRVPGDHSRLLPAEAGR